MIQISLRLVYNVFPIRIHNKQNIPILDRVVSGGKQKRRLTEKKEIELNVCKKIIKQKVRKMITT